MVGGEFDRVSRQVGITGRRLNLRVAEQFADHRQALSGGNGSRGERVPQIVDADVLQPGAGADTLPERLQDR